MSDEATPRRTSVPFTPLGLRKLDDETLAIDWSDGATMTYPVRPLRQACPCAQCVDEVTGKRTLDPESVPADIRPQRITPVGRYAFTIAWSDGHSTGIYTYTQLRELGTPTD